MEENKYTLAGWLAIAQVVLYPLMFVVMVIEGVLTARLFHGGGFIFGFSDLLQIVGTGISVYLLLMFRRLIRERYGNHELDVLILIAVGCLILFQACSLALTFFVAVFWPSERLLVIVVSVAFLTAALVTTGIVDILIAVRLLKVKETLGEYVRAFAYVTMATGICEISVLLCPFLIVLAPVSAIILALVFFREQREVEFV